MSEPPGELPPPGATSSDRPSEAPATDALSLEQAADRYSVSTTTLRRRLREGEIAGAYKVAGPKGDEWRLPRGALEALGYRELEPEPPPPLAAPDEPPPAQMASLMAALERLTLSLDVERRQLAAATEDREDAWITAARLEAELNAERERRQELEQRLEQAEQARRRRWWQRLSG